jgi:hypothetical protein
VGFGIAESSHNASHYIEHSFALPPIGVRGCEHLGLNPYH